MRPNRPNLAILMVLLACLFGCKSAHVAAGAFAAAAAVTAVRALSTSGSARRVESGEAQSFAPSRHDRAMNQGDEPAAVGNCTVEHEVTIQSGVTRVVRVERCVQTP